MTHELDHLRVSESSSDEIAEARRLHEQALFCRDLGRYDEAELLYRRALDVVDAALGLDHLQAASLYRNLGRLEHTRGRAAEGEALARWGLKIRERALGPDHPEVAADKAALAAILGARGNSAEAEELYRHALAVFERAFGPEHPCSLACRECLRDLTPSGRS